MEDRWDQRRFGISESDWQSWLRKQSDANVTACPRKDAAAAAAAASSAAATEAYAICSRRRNQKPVRWSSLRSIDGTLDAAISRTIHV